MAVSASAFFYLRRIKQNYHVLSEQNLPTSIAASKLMKLCQRLMAYESIIVLADNQLIREAHIEDFLDDICLSRQLLNILGSTSNADKEVQDIAQHFAFLADNMNRLIDFSNRNARIAGLHDQVMSRLRELSNVLGDTSSADRNLLPMERDAYTKFHDDLYHQISILLHLQYATDKTAIDELEREFISLSQKTDRSLQQWPILTETASSWSKAEIDNYGKKMMDAFAQRLEQISIQHLIQENLIQNQFIFSELGKRVDILFTAISKKVDDSWHQFDRLMHYLSIMTLVLPLIVSLLALSFYMYMRRSVIKRIMALEKSMRSYRQGGLAKIIADGNDEITSMAKSVFYFIHTRDQYQTSLNRTIAQTARATRKLARGDLSARIKVLDDDPTRYLSMSFNQMADRIEYLIISQRHIIQAVSHELRTPLSRIAFNLEMISEEHRREPKKHLVSEISNDIDEIDNLVKEMLLYSKFSSSSVELAVEPIRLPDALNRMVTLQKTTNGRFIEIDIRNGTTKNIDVTAHPFYFKLAIQNLLANAVRYALRKVWIRYYRISTGVRIEVCDDGPGIPLEARHIVFEPFARLDGSRDRKTGGAGLGLAIVKRILELHGGTVSILDNDGQGIRMVTFWPSN
jgi:signal transduction histidine kinase